MGYRYNPLIYSGLDLTGGSGGAPFFMPPVPTEGDLPSPATNGELRVVLDTDHIYVYNGDTGLWRDTGMTEATMFGTTPNNIGYDLEVEVQGGIERNVLILQPADASNPGGVTTDTQTFSGEKTFVDASRFQGGIIDGAGLQSANTESRILYDSTEVISVDWQNRDLYDETGIIQVGWRTEGISIPQLDPDTVPFINSSNILESSLITPTELDYLSGVTSSIQDQLNSKLNRSPGDIDETLFVGIENAVNDAITDFVFASSVRTFDALVDIQVDATTALYEYKKLIGINKGAGWQLYVQSFGDDTNIDFTIDITGQLLYSSSTYIGFNSLEIKFRAITLNS